MFFGFFHFGFVVNYGGMEKANTLRQLPLKVLTLSLVIFGVVLFLLFALGFIQFIPLSWAFGWFLGAVIGTLNYGLIILQANRLTLSIQNGLKPNAGPGYMMARLVIFGIGLMLAAVIKFENNELFNIFAVFLAYLVISATIFVTGANFQVKRKVIK